MEELREIALILLEKWKRAEEDCIYEYSSDIGASLERMEKVYAEYKERIASIK